MGQNAEGSRPVRVLPTDRPVIWAFSTLISVGLLWWVLSAVAWEVLWGALRGAAIPLLVLAFLAILGEAVCSSLRLHVFARHPARASQPLTNAFRANALFVAALAILPARLGEVVGMVTMNRLLKVSGGGSAMAVIAQRLLDLAVLAGLVLPIVALAGAALGEASGLLAVLALGVVLGTVGVVLAPLSVLTPLAGVAVHYRRRWVSVGRLVLQARSWTRHILPRIGRGSAVGLSLGKWTANLLGLSCIVLACGIDLGPTTLIAIAAFYNFLLTIPVPTLGGIGLGEAGLTALLTAVDVPLGEAAAAGILLRGFLLIFPLIYLPGTFAILGLLERGRR